MVKFTAVDSGASEVHRRNSLESPCKIPYASIRHRGPVPEIPEIGVPTVNRKGTSRGRHRLPSDAAGNATPPRPLGRAVVDRSFAVSSDLCPYRATWPQHRRSQRPMIQELTGQSRAACSLLPTNRTTAKRVRSDSGAHGTNPRRRIGTSFVSATNQEQRRNRISWFNVSIRFRIQSSLRP